MTSESDSLVLRTTTQILNLGIDGMGPLKSAEEVAAEYLELTGGDVEDAIRRSVRMHVRYSTTTGAATGLGGIITLPVTLTAGLAGSYVINTRMVATVAHLRGYDVHSEEVRTIILASLLGAGGAAALQKAGIEIGNKAALAAVRRVPGRVLIEINKKVGFRLVTKAGEKGVVNMTKLVPLVGAPIGATAENITSKSVSRYALKNFPPTEPGAAVTSQPADA